MTGGPKLNLKALLSASCTSSTISTDRVSTRAGDDDALLTVDLAAGKLFGIMDDLNMTTEQFATAISILFGTCRVRVTMIVLILSRIPALPAAVQLDHLANHPTGSLHLLRRRHLGVDQRCDRRSPDVRGATWCPSHPWCCRGRLLPGRNLPAQCLVHQKRAG